TARLQTECAAGLFRARAVKPAAGGPAQRPARVAQGSGKTAAGYRIGERPVQVEVRGGSAAVQGRVAGGKAYRPRAEIRIEDQVRPRRRVRPGRRDIDAEEVAGEPGASAGGHRRRRRGLAAVPGRD